MRRACHHLALWARQPKCGLAGQAQWLSCGLHTSPSLCEVHVDSSTKISGVAALSTRPQAQPFLSWLKPSSSSPSRVLTPLSQPLADISLPLAPRLPSTPPPTEITVLPNGVHIISEASQGPTASIGLYVNSGSIYEDSSNSGCSALLECMAFKTSQHRGTLNIMQEVEQAGSTMSAMASREQMSYTMDCLKTSLPITLELLCDAVLNPAFLSEEVEEQKMRLAMLLEGKDVALTLLNEQLVRTAFSGALASPLIPDKGAVAALTPAKLHAFHKKHFAGPRLVLAAAGVDHKQLVELATPMLSLAPSVIMPAQPVSSYQGGHVSLDTPSTAPVSNLIVAWEYDGGWRDVEGAVAMTVFTYLMGGGDSFSSGGPGKGMHSRLYTRVLNSYYWVHSCSAFNATFNDFGLVGIQAVCEPGRATAMLDVMCREMELAARSLTVAEVDRAKRVTLATISNALESKSTSAEDIGRQWLTYGQRISGREYARMIEAVTPQDINKFVARLLESRPSLAAHGKGSAEASYDTLLQRYSQEPLVTVSQAKGWKLWK